MAFHPSTARTAEQPRLSIASLDSRLAANRLALQWASATRRENTGQGPKEIAVLLAYSQICLTKSFEQGPKSPRPLHPDPSKTRESAGRY